MFKGMPVKSISFDKGSELAEFKAEEQELWVPVYFAEPHKSWQRGTNETTNGLLRFFFPKGCDFRAFTDERPQGILDLINHIGCGCTCLTSCH